VVLKTGIYNFLLLFTLYTPFVKERNPTCRVGYQKRVALFSNDVTVRSPAELKGRLPFQARAVFVHASVTAVHTFLCTAGCDSNTYIYIYVGIYI
jgi:hypothetical protein